MVLHAQEEKFESAFRKQVGVFLSSLDEEQAKKCLFEVTDKRRHKKQYTGGVRPGISIGQLNEKQRAGSHAIVPAAGCRGVCDSSEPFTFDSVTV